MSENSFLKPAEFYKREINPISQYIEQMGFYLSKMANVDVESAKRFITDSLKNRKFAQSRDPLVHHFDRDENGDRIKTESRLSNYLSSVVKENQIIVPTGTTYVPPSVDKSILVGFIDNNVKIRSKAKKEAFVAKAAGNTSLYIAKNNEQDNRKRYNNSMSGAFAAGGCVLNNPTGHSTLTSITRTVSSLGNASNEKIIAGNRHYRNADIVLANLIAITSSIDKDELSQVITKYSLHYPTADEVMDCIRHSASFYTADTKTFEKVEAFVNALDRVERAGFVYYGDFYHIRKHNPAFVDTFLTKLSKKIFNGTIENPRQFLSKADELVVNYAHAVCMNEVKGIGKNYDKISDEAAQIVASTVQNIENVVNEYRDFINAIFLTRNIPASTAYIPNMLRRSVVLSDTDSTMFSVDEWVEWKYKKLDFSDEAFAYAGGVMFIATQCIAHALAIFSANMGVERSKLHTLAMKPEFCFPVFAQTSVAKHYYTCILVKEGNVYKDLDWEIKGVYLKNSAAPKDLIKSSQSTMKEILKEVMAGNRLAVVPQIERVANTERSIKSSLLNGEVEYYKQSTIKNHEAYARSAEESPYLHHLFWQEVFEPKYGKVDLLPYKVIKIPTTLDTKSAFQNWINSMEDQDLAKRIRDWAVRYKKLLMPTLYISTTHVKAFGLPKEIKPIINVKKIVMELTMQDRMVLETLGYFPKNDWLISETGF